MNLCLYITDPSNRTGTGVWNGYFDLRPYTYPMKSLQITIAPDDTLSSPVQSAMHRELATPEDKTYLAPEDSAEVAMGGISKCLVYNGTYQL